MSRLKSIRICLILGVLFISPHAWGDQWLSPHEVTIKSPSGLWEAKVTPADRIIDISGYLSLIKRLPSIKTDELSDQTMESWAKATIWQSNREALTFALRSPWMPVESVLLDNGILVTFDQWHGTGYGEVCIAYSPNGKVLWARTLTDLIGQAYMHSFRQSASSITWRTNPFKWSVESDGEALVVNLADANQLRIQIADGKANIIEISDLGNDAQALYDRADSILNGHTFWRVFTPGSDPMPVVSSDTEKAIDLLRQAVTLNPDDPYLVFDIYSRLLSTLKAINRYEEAIETGKIALKRLKECKLGDDYLAYIDMMLSDTDRLRKQ
jgi:hypothetical protein